METERDPGEMDQRLEAFLRLVIQPSAFVLGLTLTFFPNPGDLTSVGRIVAVIGMVSLASSVAINFTIAYVASIRRCGSDGSPACRWRRSSAG